MNFWKINFLSDNIATIQLDLDCKKIIDCIEKLNKNKNFLKKVNYRPHLTNRIPKEIFNFDCKELIYLKNTFKENIKPSVDEYFKIKNILIKDRSNILISKLIKGMDMEPHVDENDMRVYDIYLNDNFKGGELFFNNLNIQIKPLPGLLAIYDPTELHSVKKVYNNDRYCIGSTIDIIAADIVKNSI
jgi:hypothetical protein